MLVNARWFTSLRRKPPSYMITKWQALPHKQCVKTHTWASPSWIISPSQATLIILPKRKFGTWLHHTKPPHCLRKYQASSIHLSHPPTFRKCFCGLGLLQQSAAGSNRERTTQGCQVLQEILDPWIQCHSHKRQHQSSTALSPRTSTPTYHILQGYLPSRGSSSTTILQ